MDTVAERCAVSVITWERTALGALYPRIEGKDVFRELSQRHGCSFLAANHPVFAGPGAAEDAERWARERGYASRFGGVK